MVVSVIAALPAAAQMYPGQDVTVNPSAIPGNGESVTLSPTGRSERHYTHHRRHHVAAAAPSDTATAASNTTAPAESTASTDNTAPASSTTATDATAPEAPVTRKHRHAKAAPDNSANSAIPFNFGEDDMAAAPAPAAKTASAEAPPAHTPAKGSDATAQTGLAKRGAIIFEHNATDPNPSQLDGIKLLAGDLNSALEAGATQIELEAFGGAPGDKSSDARRIALKRALAIRQLLIDNGVPSNRIITRAMGGITDSGEPDRVDIYVRAS